jgi:hypothetical protein
MSLREHTSPFGFLHQTTSIWFIHPGNKLSGLENNLHKYTRNVSDNALDTSLEKLHNLLSHVSRGYINFPQSNLLTSSSIFSLITRYFTKLSTIPASPQTPAFCPVLVSLHVSMH